MTIPTRRMLAEAIADGWTNGNEKYDQQNDIIRMRIDDAAIAVLDLLNVAQRQRGPSLDAQHDAQLEGLAIGLLQRGEKSAAHIIRLAIDRLGVSAQGPTDRERAAQIIYEAFPFDGGAAEKPPWLPGGNSLMQDRARRAADAIVASARLTPAQAPMDREKVAKIFAYIWHGDLGEWQGFLSKADAFLTYPVPSTEHHGAAPQAAVENQADGNVGRSPMVPSTNHSGAA